MKKIFASLFVAATLTPFVLMAQTDMSMSTLLRSEIRSALLQDPRSAALPEGELSAMVELLAGEVEAQSATTDFVLPPLTFLEDFSISYYTPWGQPLSAAMLYGIILVCLGLSLLLLKKMVAVHRAHVLAAKGSLVS